MVSDRYMEVLAERMAAIRKDRRPDPSPARTRVPRLQPQEKDSYTQREAAEKLGVSIPTLQKMKIPTFRFGRIIRIRRQDLEDFIASHTQAAHHVPRDAESRHVEHRDRP